MQITISSKRVLFSAAALSLTPTIGPYTTIANAQSGDPVVRPAIRFVIPSQDLEQALRQFSEQSAIPILFSEAIVSGRQAPRLDGAFEPDEGLTNCWREADWKLLLDRAGHA